MTRLSLIAMCTLGLWPGSSAWCPAARHSAWKLGPKTLANLVKWWMLLITFLLTFSLSLSKLKFHEVPPSETKWKNNEEWLQPKQNVEQMIHGDLKIEQPLLRFNLKKNILERNLIRNVHFPFLCVVIQVCSSIIFWTWKFRLLFIKVLQYNQ